MADEIKAALREVVHEELPALLRAHFPQMEPTAVPEVPGSLSVTETAKLAHRHPDTIRRAIKAGVLHATRPAGAREWIIDRAEVERWIRGSHSPDPTSMQAEVEKAVARVLDRWAPSCQTFCMTRSGHGSRTRLTLSEQLILGRMGSRFLYGPKDARVVFRCPAELRDRLSSIASSRGRNLSNMIVSVLTDWLLVHGRERMREERRRRARGKTR